LVDDFADSAGETSSQLILLRHGQSTSNAEGRFTGWTDVSLTAEGRRQARDVGVQLRASGVVPSHVHTSLLTRAIQTAEICLAEASLHWLPVQRTWRLNERQYGALAGRLKAQVRDEAGEELYWAWRNSLDVAPPPMQSRDIAALRADPRYVSLPKELIPPSESLGGVVKRIRPYWTDVLAPQLFRGGTVLVVAHGNSLRALIGLVGQLSASQIERLRVGPGELCRFRWQGSSRMFLQSDAGGLTEPSRVGDRIGVPIPPGSSAVRRPE
jgi:2,3-bisphosphoglycerate-dependent phosphoglycerate mutase